VDNLKPQVFWSADSQTRLQLAQYALDNARDSLLIHDEQGRLVYFNRATAVGLGYTPEEFTRLNPADLVGDEPLGAVARHRETALQSGSTHYLTSRAAADGSRRIFEVESRRIETADGPLVVSAAQDVTERIHADHIMRHLAFHDPLTDLANRALFDDRLEQALLGAQRHHSVVGLAYLDVDEFKHVNDTYGHGFGDEVLKALGQRLANGVRSEDTVARLGGDEFAIIFPHLTHENDLAPIAQKLSAQLSAPMVIEGTELVLEVSHGLAIFDPAADNARSLIMRADVQMYEAKRARSATRVLR
jgi:diguanylate cyclase (GGDEF)-like protein/PAS domain S-box-containing protein